VKKLILLLAFLSTNALATPVNITLANGLIANADYQIGKNNKPAVMVVHGFLSTYNYGTIQAIASDLTGKGYTVITPNLTLGVNNRNEPLACDQAHKNTLADEGKELAQWATWLSKKGHQQLIMIGHSAGSSSILASLENNPVNLKQVILTAIYDFENWPEATLVRDKKTAQQNLQIGKLASYSVGFCRGNFLASSNAYLSYRHWDKERILDTINRENIMVNVIMPGSDKRLEGGNREWLEQLNKSKAKLSVIKNADHFFSSDAEFDLNEAINQAIEHK
jgi:pimeloyl-ACP methyl ester carboxylesterase